MSKKDGGDEVTKSNRNYWFSSVDVFDVFDFYLVFKLK